MGRVSGGGKVGMSWKVKVKGGWMGRVGCQGVREVVRLGGGRIVVWRGGGEMGGGGEGRMGLVDKGGKGGKERVEVGEGGEGLGFKGMW